MNLNTLIQVLMRHRIVVSALVVITISTAWGFWVSVLPTYKSEAVVWVIPPSKDNLGNETNPFLGISAKSNDLVAKALALSVNSPEWREPLVEQGYANDYLVDDGDGDSPLLSVIVEADDRDLSLATRDAVLSSLEQELEAMQTEADAPPEDRFTVNQITVLPARVQYGTRDRLVASTVLLGLLAAVAFALLLDAFERSRDEPTNGRRPEPRPEGRATGETPAIQPRASQPTRA